MGTYSDLEKEDYGKKIASNARFDSDKIDIVPWKMIVSNVVSRLRDDAIVLDSDFQRSPNLWGTREQSRLIESMIINLPLPVFYFDRNKNDDKYTVIDGLQRLCTIRNFIVLPEDDKRKLKLEHLEYLPEFEGYTYEMLPINLQRRLNEFELNTYIINASTPSFIKKSIFKRINTGGLVLTDQEIRNAAFYGKATKMLREISNSTTFKYATCEKINPKRMKDRELLNRYFAFQVLGFDDYSGDLDFYYDTVLDKINMFEDDKVEEIKKHCLGALDRASKLFEKNAFRRYNEKGKFVALNAPLFECVLISLTKISDEDFQKLLNNKNEFIDEYKKLLLDEKFDLSISKSTASKNNVIYRNNEMLELIYKFVR